MKIMLVTLATNISRDGQRIAVIGTNRIVKLALNRWPCCGTVQRATALQTNHLYTKHTPLFLLKNTSLF